MTVELLYRRPSLFLVDRATRNPKEMFGLRPGVGCGRDSATRRQEERGVRNDSFRSWNASGSSNSRPRLIVAAPP